jgi:transposase-like protein
MELYPANMIDWMDLFSTEQACLQYLSKVRWPQGYMCLRCGSGNYWKMQDEVYRCRNCRYTASVTAGTLFAGTHKPLRLWMAAMWYLVNQKNGVSALGLQKALGLGSYHTAWEWMHKLRRAMVRPGRDRLSGIVEVDETLVGGEHRGKPGRQPEVKTLVLVAAEARGQRIGRIRLAKLPNASAKTLAATLEQIIEPGSTVHTDGWDGYQGLPSRGYLHQPTRRHAAVSGDATPLAHLVASLLKRWLLGTHQGAVSRKYLGYYLDEFTFRFNRRTSRSRGKLFYRLVEQAVHLDPMPIHMLLPHT